MKQVLTTKQKALIVNLNNDIYGAFTEIGAGQETVRNFFRAGAASGTIAKAISAYDKAYSDAIYGKEENSRYVTESRLKKMLTHEMHLMEERLQQTEHAPKHFFVYANTVATINYTKTFKGHGWIGLRFQRSANETYSEIILHVRFHENDAKLQQETLGELGTNLIYGAYYYSDNPKQLLESLYDNISRDRIEIDMINFSGTLFSYVDNRLMSLMLIKNGMTEVAMFGPNGYNLLPGNELYKKNVLTIRGSFRPVTLVNMDMLKCGYDEFIKEEKVADKQNIETVFEITLANLKATGEINERDFLDRADILGSLGYNVLITNYSEYYKLVEFLSQYTKEYIGLIMGVNNLLEVFDEGYYRDLSGGILEAFGKLFTRDLKIYLYPYLDKSKNELLTSENLKVNPNLKELYKYFKENKRIADLKQFDKKVLNIHSREIIKDIMSGKRGWESKVPKAVDDIIIRRGLFGYQKEYILD